MAEEVGAHHLAGVAGGRARQRLRCAQRRQSIGAAYVVQLVDRVACRGGGGWSGDGDNLSNSGERVTLEKPQESDDPMDPTDISWIIVDEVMYGDTSPWPISPDSGGDALQRKVTAMDGDDSGHDPANWEADTPSPGQ